MHPHPRPVFDTDTDLTNNNGDDPSDIQAFPPSSHVSDEAIENTTEEEVLRFAESLFRELVGVDGSLSIGSCAHFIDQVLLRFRVDGRRLRSAMRIHMRNSIIAKLDYDLRADDVRWDVLRHLLFAITRRITSMRSLFE